MFGRNAEKGRKTPLEIAVETPEVNALPPVKVEYEIVFKKGYYRSKFDRKPDRYAVNLINVTPYSLTEFMDGYDCRTPELLTEATPETAELMVRGVVKRAYCRLQTSLMVTAGNPRSYTYPEES